MSKTQMKTLFIRRNNINCDSYFSSSVLLKSEKKT